MAAEDIHLFSSFVCSSRALSIVVIGASGDLAKKKTFPALFHLFKMGLLPPTVIIAGYARSNLSVEDFQKKISSNFADDPDKDKFLARCFYHAGQYGSVEDFGKLAVELETREKEVSEKGANRVFYLAIPPTLFVEVAAGISGAAISSTGWNRVIVEKPFGHDSESSKVMGAALAQSFTEDQIYRIDHYLGKEMVQNLMTMRFANQIFEPIWNRHYIKAVILTFKEDFGTKGRGGYFDKFGIIRDVLQNHLMQVMALTGMEPPTSLNAEDVRDAKVRFLRSIPPIRMEDVVIGQYGAAPDGRESSYLDDPTVPNDSITPTYACVKLHVNNERWAGVPFILKAGKALDERKAEVRIQFSKPQNFLFGSGDVSNNELVMRLQPNEAVYMKMTTKKPGLGGGVVHTEMDLSYNTRFSDEEKGELKLPDAYEQLILECVRGDHNLFVRSDELEHAWNIFTPILHQLEREQIKPTLYEYGGRGPPAADEMIAASGYERTVNYSWRRST